MKAIASVLGAVLLVAATSAQAQRPRALVFTQDGHPLAVLPQPGQDRVVSSFSIGRSAYSPDGRHWAITAVIAASNTEASSTALITGDLSGRKAFALANETLPGLGLAFSTIPTSLAVGDSGDVVFGTQVTGASAADRVIVARYRAATGLYDKVARQTEPIPGIGQVVPGANGERYGSIMTVSAVTTEGNAAALLAENTTGPLSSLKDEVLLVEGQPVRVLAQADTTVPTGQSGGSASTLINLDRPGAVGADGQGWLVVGQLAKAGNPDVVVVNGHVVLEEGMPVAGLAGNIVTPIARLHPGNRWTARGTSSARVPYLIADGVLRVIGGAPVRGLPELGPVSRIDSAAMNARGDLVYSVSTAIGPWWIVVEPADGSRPFVAVGPGTPLDVGWSPRGPVYYGGLLNPDLGLGVSDDTIFFTTRSRDGNDRSAGDGLFVMPFPRAPADPVPVE